MAVSLTSSGPTVPLVGSPVTWTATTSDHGATPVYQFSVGLAGSTLNVVRDYYTTNSFTWDPLQEGTYDIQVNVMDGYYGDSSGESASASYTAQTRITGTSAVVSPTANPLVAL